jgi:hypothetical protein
VKSNGKIIYNRKKVIQKYILYQFLIDLVTCIPMQNQIDFQYFTQNVFRLLNLITLYRNNYKP